jgi:3',5'-nucleoside bisphosphate phosphatase
MSNQFSEYDLHCHSTVSDGTLTPDEVVARAAHNGVKVLALTDHDNVDGIDTAIKAATRHDIKIIPGVEISCSWHGYTVHITALNIDHHDRALQNMLGKLQEFRIQRGEKIGRKLEKHGIPDAYQGAKNFMQGDLLTRTHYAQFLLDGGYAKNMQDAFNKYLLKNKPGHVGGKWAELTELVETVNNAGGIACIAHPKRYKMTNTKLRALIAEFKDAGGKALEVVCGHSNPDSRQYLANLSQKFGLMASVGSDFHFPGGFVELGRLEPLPKICTPIWQAFQ